MSRETRADDAPTVAHMGVGAFHRAHQAWYVERTSTSPDAWRIAAFTGRSPRQAQLLQRRRGRYTLVTRGADADGFTSIRSIRSAHDGADHGAWEATLASPHTHIVTMTVTEAGYRLDAHGRLDVSDPAVSRDLRSAVGGSDASITTMPVRLALGLAARRRAGAGAITIISCDNLRGNGEAARAGTLAAARVIDPSLTDWIDANVSFCASMVDRITPRTRPEDIDEVERQTGVRDHATVVAEPFAEWIIEDRFAGRRPDFAQMGVCLTADLEPFEERKLRILNGAHSLLAYLGLLRGHTDVAGAFDDPAVRDVVENYWDTAAASCSLSSAELRSAVDATRERFQNPRIRHPLDQIALDGTHKLRHRLVPVLEHAVRAGADATSPAAGIAAWVRHDSRSPDELAEVLSGVQDENTIVAMRAVIMREIRRLEKIPLGASARTEAVRS